MNTEISINDEDIVIATDDNGKRYYVAGSRDDFYDWICDTDTMGRLITWHSRYCIGDHHSFDDPIDFWIDVFERLYDRGENEEDYKSNMRFLCSLMLGCTKCTIFSKEELRGKKTYHNPLDFPYYLCRVNEVGDFIEVSDWGELTTNNVAEMVTDDFNEFLALLRHLDRHEYVSMASHSPDFVFYPVYMYDHGLRQLSLKDFGDPWDSGCLGIFCCTKEEAKAAYRDTDTDSWKQSFRNYVEIAIEEFNDMELGNVWGFAFADADLIDSYKETVEGFKAGLWYSNLSSAIFVNKEDSCWGYHGEYDALIREYCRDEHLEIIGVLDK